MQLFFTKKPMPPLEGAIHLVEQAVEIAYVYLRRRDYTPSDDELRCFEQLVQTLWQNYTTLHYIAQHMRERAN